MSPVMAYVMLRRACVACGISTAGVSLHSLRRAYAAQCWQISRDLLVVQRCLGHASVLTTSIYLAGNQSEADRVVQQVADALPLTAPAARAAQEEPRAG